MQADETLWYKLKNDLKKNYSSSLLSKSNLDVDVIPPFVPLNGKIQKRH